MEKLKANEEKLKKEIKSRGLSWADDEFNTSMYDYEQRVWKQDGQIHFPVMFIYPQVKQSDFIKAFSEEHAFIQHLFVMFEKHPAWDTAKEYKSSDLEVYYFNKTKKLKKIDTNKPLKKVLQRDDYDIPNIPVFFVLPGSNSYRNQFFKEAKDIAQQYQTQNLP